MTKDLAQRKGRRATEGLHAWHRNCPPVGLLIVLMLRPLLLPFINRGQPVRPADSILALRWQGPCIVGSAKKNPAGQVNATRRTSPADQGKVR